MSPLEDLFNISVVKGNNIKLAILEFTSIAIDSYESKYINGSSIFLGN